MRENVNKLILRINRLIPWRDSGPVAMVRTESKCLLVKLDWHQRLAAAIKLQL